MGKLRRLSGHEVCKILSDHEFHKVCQKGSHIIMQKRTETSSITIPVPNHPELKIGTLLSIIRQSGLARQLFES